MRYLPVLLLLAACDRPAPVAAPTQADRDLIACRDAVKAELIDPESVQFSEESCRVDGFNRRVCTLTYNAKNRMGGYAGRKPRGCWIDPVTGKVEQLT